MNILYVFIGGGIGAVSRYFCGSIIHTVFDTNFPIGTLIINALGSFVIGLLWGFAEEFNFSPQFRSFVFIGILGGYTTFSSYSLETLNLFRANSILYAFLNIVLSNLAGILLAISGFLLSRLFVHFFR